MWWTFSVNKVKYGAHSVFCPLPKYVQEAVPAQVREIAMKFGA
jgi:hypothetical protein